MEQKDLNNLPWKTVTCPSGEKCWCRIITTETPVYDKDGNELYIVSAGSVMQENADHIVEIHNQQLKG